MKHHLMFLLIIQISITGMEKENKEIFPLCQLPQEILNKEILPKLMDFESDKKFKKRIVQNSQKNGWNKDTSNPWFVALNAKNRFAADYAIGSNDNSYIGIVSTKKNCSQIEIVKNDKKNTTIDSYEAKRRGFVGMAVSNSAKKIVTCFIDDEKKLYDLELVDIETKKSRSLKPVPIKNIKLAHIIKPTIFFNSHEASVGLWPPTPPKILVLENMQLVKPEDDDEIYLRNVLESNTFTKFIEKLSNSARIKLLLDLFKYAKVVQSKLEDDTGKEKNQEWVL